jgi:two-component system cell cycle sensor histidine kinase/response regulator CckA
MADKPSYKELQKKIRDLEQQLTECKEEGAVPAEYEERYRALFERSNCCVYIHDLSGKFLDANDAALNLLGFDRDEIDSLNFATLLDEEQIPTAVENLQEILSQGLKKQTTEFKLRKKDGSHVWVKTDACLVYKKGEPCAVQGVAVDISELKRAEEALRQSKESFRSAFENAAVGMAIVALDGKFLEVNSYLANMLGYTEKELAALNVKEVTYEEDLEIDITKHRMLIKGEIPNLWIEKRYCHRDGDVIWGRVSSSLVRGADAKPLYFVSQIQDITEHKRADEALRESEERYRKLFENAADIIVVIDTEGNLVDLNERFEEESFYKREEMIGKNVFNSGIMTESSARLTTQYLQKFFAGEPWSIFEIDGLRKDGEAIPYEIRAVPIEKNGSVIGVQAILRNIADRKRAEVALQKSEEKYRSILENMEEGYYEVDLAGNFTFFNDSLCKFFGYSRDEMLGMNNRALSTPKMSALIYRLYNQVYKTGQPINFIDYEVIAKDGSKLIVEGSASLMRDNSGQPIGFCGVFRDVTEHKKAEEALRESEEQYRKLYDSVSDFIFTHDAEGRFITINRATTEYLGYTADELIGRPIADFMFPKYRETFNEEYLAEIKKKGFYEGVSVYLNRSGEKLYVEYRNTLVEREGKEPYITGVGRDITERVKSQKEMEILERQVQHAQRMEAIGTLAGGIAHNFNNLLMGIRGYTSLMLLETDSDHPFHEWLKNIEKLVQSGARMSGQLLGYARGGRYEVKPIGLNDVVQETSDTFGTTRKDIKIHRELAEDLFGVKADKAQIEQILLNLYVNAADAMPGGGSLYLNTLNVTHEAMTNKPYAVKPGNYVLLTVRDTGGGMDKETMARIFEPFFTTKGLAKGTGLGLASVYGILKSHGGYIDVESEKGHGTKFYVYLPGSEEVVAKVISTDEKFVMGSETILLVDDEELVLDAGAQLIEAMGYRVLKAKNGAEAVEVYRRNRDTIDLVILDVVMPEMGGGETYDRLREIDTGIKVLLSSGYSLDGEAGEIMRRGCDGFIQKPFKLEKLSKKLREILDKR